MKTDRHIPRNWRPIVKLVCIAAVLTGGLIVASERMSVSVAEDPYATDSSALSSIRPATPNAPSPRTVDTSAKAQSLLHRVVTTLVNGPAFDAKVRETVWTGGREVVGVGTYEQAGMGTGRYNLQVTMHDGDGKHRLQQISDGRLAWTRSEIAGNVSLRRVDVGRLDQWVSAARTGLPVSPRLQVGAWVEMLASFLKDYDLQVKGAHLKERPIWVVSGKLKSSKREQVMADSGLDEWPLLYPTKVRVAVQAELDPATSFGAFLPVRIEFWSDPLMGDDDQADASAGGQGRLITLIEIYSIRPVSPPPVERFRFENQDDEVNFTNDTDFYIQQYGVQLTERQRRQLRR